MVFNFIIEVNEYVKGRRKKKEIWRKAVRILKEERINGWVLEDINGRENKEVWRKREKDKLNIIQ
jgi:hypothetical protein